MYMLSFVSFGWCETPHDRSPSSSPRAVHAWCQLACGCPTPMIFTETFVHIKVIQQRMLYSQTHIQYLQKCRVLWGQALGCLLLPSLDGFCGTISPVLCREGSQIQPLPQLWVPECVRDDVGISSLFLMVASSEDVSVHFYHTVTSTTNACISFTKLSVVCITHCCRLLCVVPEILSNLAFLHSLIMFHMCNCAF